MGSQTSRITPEQWDYATSRRLGLGVDRVEDEWELVYADHSQWERAAFYYFMHRCRERPPITLRIADIEPRIGILVYLKDALQSQDYELKERLDQTGKGYW